MQVSIDRSATRWLTRASQTHHLILTGAAAVVLSAVALFLTPGPARSVPPGTFNVQVRAIEVTQGVRGEIPYRMPPDGDFVIPSDGYEQIANRRTVVRVYAWIEADPETPLVPLTCQLTGYEGPNTLPGSPLAPVNTWVLPQPHYSLEGMRALSARSWNFDLPSSWIDVPLSETERVLTFRADVNPAGPNHVDECSGCEGDNFAYLSDQVFRHVTGHRVPQFAIRPLFVRPTYDLPGMGTTTADPAPFSFLSAMIREIDLTHPNATQRSTHLVYPAVVVDFEGLRDGTWGRQVRRFLPGGSFSGIPHGDHIVSVWPIDGPGLNCAGGGARDGYAAIDACAFVYRHELAHSHGRRHPGGHGEEFVDPDYPGMHGEVEAEAYGYDMWSHVAYQPRMTPVPDDNPEGMTHDYLSGATSPKWSSIYTWENIKTDIRTDIPEAGRPGAPTDGDYALVTGDIDGADNVTLEPLVATAVPVRSIVNNGPYHLEFRDNAGNVLGTHQLPEANGLDGPAVGLSFSETVPAPTGWVSLAVVDGANTLYQASRSPGAPLVFLTTPQPGAQWLGGQNLMQWQAFDPEADPMWFRPEVSTDGGQSWMAACAETSDLEALVDVGAVAASGGAWLLRVQASDGLNWGVSEVVDVTVPPKPPWAVISQPADGELIPSSECGVSAGGTGGDWNDGLLDGQSLTWLLDGQPVGTGVDVELPSLPLGPHEIVLGAQNGFGLSAYDTVSVTVVPNLAPPTLIAPQPGSVEPGPEVALKWTGVTGATMYDVQVALDPNMTDLVEDLEGFALPYFGTGSVEPGATYYWRIRGRTICVAGQWSQVQSFTMDEISGIPVGRVFLPARLAFPNPFRRETTLAFRVDHESDASIRVVDVRGRVVATLWRGRLAAGEHTVVWNGENEAGRPVGAGVYRAWIETGRSLESRPLVVLR